MSNCPPVDLKAATEEIIKMYKQTWQGLLKMANVDDGVTVIRQIENVMSPIDVALMLHEHNDIEGMVANVQLARERLLELLIDAKDFGKVGGDKCRWR